MPPTSQAGASFFGATIEGAFILSLNDRPEVRETFARFRIEAVTTTYSVQGGGQAAGEVIIQRR